MILENNLKKLRFEHNQLTQDELAKALSISRQTVNAIENGKFNPSTRLALMLADYFKCKVENIFHLEEDK